MPVLATEIIQSLSRWSGIEDLTVAAYLSVGLVALVCGMVGSTVMANRMAFFSDAMAHCAFAGVGLGIVLALTLGGGSPRASLDRYQWVVPLCMVGFGAATGLAIAVVREKTGLASDTVIGVFFAGAIGFGAMLLKGLEESFGKAFSPDGFLFGSPYFVQDRDLIYLLLLAISLGAFFYWRYNNIALSSLNRSLAMSRGVPVARDQYLLVVFLAMVVNLSISSVGALLINAMLIVPAASSSRIARSLRGQFWLTIALSLAAGWGGLWLSDAVRVPLGDRGSFRPGPSGTITCLSVLGFFLAMTFSAARSRRHRTA